jgi:hypothetical protein
MAVNAKVATVLGSITASSDIMESEGVLHKKRKNIKKSALNKKGAKGEKEEISVQVKRTIKTGGEWNKKYARKDAEGYNRTVI